MARVSLLREGFYQQGASEVASVATNFYQM